MIKRHMSHYNLYTSTCSSLFLLAGVCEVDNFDIICRVELIASRMASVRSVNKEPGPLKCFRAWNHQILTKSAWRVQVVITGGWRKVWRRTSTR